MTLSGGGEDSALVRAGGVEAGKARAVLYEAVKREGTWLSVHAAEYLVKLGDRRAVVEAFGGQADSAGPPFRIGVWRVLALAEGTEGGRAAYVERIRRVLLDRGATDRLHAMEALSKIGAAISSAEEGRVVREAAGKSGAGAPFALWRLGIAGEGGVSDELVRRLGSADETTRFRAAYVMGQLGERLSGGAREALVAAAAREPKGSGAYGALATAAADGETLLELVKSSDVAVRRLAVGSIVARGAGDRVRLERLLSDEDVEVRVAAAYGLLARGER